MPVDPELNSAMSALCEVAIASALRAEYDILLQLGSRCLVRRRGFILGVSGSAAWALAAQAQQIGRVRWIGILMPSPRSNAELQTRVQVFRQELAWLGWSEGSNVQSDERWSMDNMDVVKAGHSANWA